MDFRYTQDQQDLIDAAKTFFAGECTVERLRKMAAGETMIWDGLYRGYYNLGLRAIMLPEKLGGLGQPLEVMAAIAESAGYVALPHDLILEAGIVFPLLVEQEDFDCVESLLDAGHTIEILSPLRPYINYAGSDTYLQVCEAGFFPVHETDLTIADINSIDPLRQRIKVDVTGENSAFVEKHGAVLTAAQLIGLSKRMVDMSVEYAKDRHQFGKPIGSFQAIKHHLATVHTQIEFTRPMVQLAAIQGGRAVHTAKIAAIDTAMLAAETAIQVHGGMGYTYEVDLHLFMKRAWALCGEWGDRNYHMKKLEDMILDGDADIGPGTSFAA